MFDVVCFGSATLDLFAHTEQKYVSQRTYHFPIGDKILLKKIDFYSGGSATNTGVSFSRLGLKTGLLIKVGDDDTSKRIIKEMEKEKVKTNLIIKAKGETGFSVILDAKGRDRTILAYKGQNDTISFKEIKNKLRKNLTDWFYFGSMIGQSFEAQKKLAEWCKKEEVKIAFNPSLYVTRMGLKKLKKIINKTNLVVMNKKELYTLMGKKSKKERERKGKRKGEQVEKEERKLIEKLSQQGPEKVIITQGEKKIIGYSRDEGKIYLAWPKKVGVMETTGAGDSFSSALLAGLIKGKDLGEAIKLGMANSESVITHLGAKNKLLKMKEAKKLVKQRKYRLISRKIEGK